MINIIGTRIETFNSKLFWLNLYDTYLAYYYRLRISGNDINGNNEDEKVFKRIINLQNY